MARYSSVEIKALNGILLTFLLNRVHIKALTKEITNYKVSATRRFNAGFTRAVQ